MESRREVTNLTRPTWLGFTAGGILQIHYGDCSIFTTDPLYSLPTDFAQAIMHPRDLLTSLITSIHSNNAPTHPLATTISNPLHNAPDSVRTALLTLHVLFPHELLPALDLLDRNLITRLTLHRHQIETNTKIPPPRNPSEPLPPRNEQTRAQTEQLRRPSQKPATNGQTARQSPQSQIPPSSSPHEIPHLNDDADLGRQNPTLDNERSSPGDPTEPAYARHADAYLVRSGQLPARVRADGMRDAGRTTTTYEVRLKAWSCSCPAFAFAAFPAGEKSGEEHAQVYQQRRDWAGKEWRFGGLTIGSDAPVCKHLLACVLVEHSDVVSGLVEQSEVSEEELAGWAAGWGD